MFYFSYRLWFFLKFTCSECVKVGKDKILPSLDFEQICPLESWYANSLKLAWMGQCIQE